MLRKFFSYSDEKGFLAELERCLEKYGEKVVKAEFLGNCYCVSVNLRGDK